MCKIKHLKVIEFEQSYGGVNIPMIAMFNSSRISEDTVREYIENGKVDHSDFVVVMFKSQYDRLYDLGESSIDELHQDLIEEQKEQM